MLRSERDDEQDEDQREQCLHSGHDITATPVFDERAGFRPMPGRSEPTPRSNARIRAPARCRWRAYFSRWRARDSRVLELPHGTTVRIYDGDAVRVGLTEKDLAGRQRLNARDARCGLAKPHRASRRIETLVPERLSHQRFAVASDRATPPTAAVCVPRQAAGRIELFEAGGAVRDDRVAVREPNRA